MRRSVLVLSLSLLVLALPAARAANVAIDDDKMLVVDGKRTFVIGLYENPGDDAVLKDVAEAGFNLVRSSNDQAALDRLQAHKLWAWLNTGYDIDLSSNRDASEDGLKQMVADFASHPALLVWEVPDEALWNNFWRAIQWRGSYEPRQLAAKTNELEDKDLARELHAMRDRAGELRHEGRYAESEDLADEIWRRLGEEPPKPDLRLSNAPERAATMCAGMIQGYELLKRLDPRHPVWMNHAPRNQISQLAAFNRAADIVGCDIYPVVEYRTGHSDMAERTIAAVGAYTDRMQASAPDKPVWMVLQGFGWRDLEDNPDPEEADEKRRPTLEETRFMAYDAIAHGARGILYWGTSRIERDSQLWADLLRVVRELDALQPVLSAPDAPGAFPVGFAPTFGSVDRGIVLLPKLVDGKVWFVVVNEWLHPLTYTIRGLDDQDAVHYVENYSEQEATVTNGALTLTIPRQSVHVLIPE